MQCIPLCPEMYTEVMGYGGAAFCCVRKAVRWGAGEEILRGEGGIRHKAMVLVCLPLAAPIGLLPLHIPTLCGSERVLVVSTEPLGDLSSLTTPGVSCPRDGLLRVPLTMRIQMHTRGGGGGTAGSGHWLLAGSASSGTNTTGPSSVVRSRGTDDGPPSPSARGGRQEAWRWSLARRSAAPGGLGTRSLSITAQCTGVRRRRGGGGSGTGALMTEHLQAYALASARRRLLAKG